ALAYGAILASRARAAYLLRQEVLKDTLAQLQLLPIREERWLWMMSAHPTALSLLIGLMGLPVYIAALLMGRWSLLDLLGLLLVFLMLGHAAPAWQPVLWKQQSAKASGQKLDWKTWQTILKQMNKDADLTRATPAQRLELQRRQQRALLALYEPQGAAPVGLPDQAEATEKPPDDKDKSRVAWGAASGSASPLWVRWMLWWAGFQFTGPLVLGLARGTLGPLSTLWHDLMAALPAEVKSLLPAFPLTWPLLMARGLFAPLPFFAFALPFILPLVPLYIGARYQHYTNLAAMVSNSETFWTSRRTRQRETIGIALLLGIVFVFFGYSWHAFIIAGAMGSLLPGALPTTGNALAAAWTLALVIAAFAARGVIRKAFERIPREELPQRAAWQEAGWGIVRALGIAMGMYFVFCWLGGKSGVSHAWLARLLPTLATVAAFVLANFGATALLHVLPEEFRFPWRAVCFLWFFDPVLEALVYIASGLYTGNPFSLDQAPHITLSPFVSLLALFRSDLWTPGAPWWWGPLFQAIVAVPCLGLAAVKVFGTSKATVEEHQEESAPSLWTRWRNLLLAPFRALHKALLFIVESVVHLFEALNQMLRNGNEWVIERSRRFDNPVLTAELKRRLHREYWPVQWLFLLLGGAAFFWLALEPWRLPVLAAASGPAAVHSWCQGVIFGVLVIAAGVGCLGVVSLGQAFDRERANSNLVFLFLTPLTDRSIVLGKLLPGLLHSGVLLTVALPFLLLVGVFYALTGGRAGIVWLLIGWGLLGVLATTVFAACLQMFFGIRAVKPTEGSAKALLFLVLEAACLIALMVWLYMQEDPTGSLTLPLYAYVPLGLPLLHGTLAYVCWQLGLRALRQRRYGDVEVTKR
ncbi:MAG: ABC transporter permease, partial [Armatimonadota bacterium]|nr:ABC transporter permease [Armatimonadota bacterium]